jgi:enoyl-CoA hydratase/carnithine racemase
MTDEVRVLTDGPIGHIIMNAPKRHNALTMDMLEVMGNALDRFEADATTRVVVIGSSGKSFCAGADFGTIRAGKLSENPYAKFIDRLENVRQPTIAALNGGVYGAGFDLALACDFRFGVPGMKASIPAARLGIYYPPDGIERVVNRLGPEVARRLFLAADTMSDKDLLQSRFLTSIVPLEQLSEKTVTAAHHIASLAPDAVQGMKMAILQAEHQHLDTAASIEKMMRSFSSAEHKEGLAALKEKRQPKFDDPSLS